MTKKPAQSAFVQRSFFSPSLNRYLAGVYASLPETPVASVKKELKKRAQQETIPIVSEEVYAFLNHTVLMKQPKSMLEIGTGGGYSALALLEGFTGEKFITLELSDHNATRFQELQEEFPLLQKASVVFCDALDYMKECTTGSFDLIFIDAQKNLYPVFLDAALPLLAPRGIMLFDNLFFSGESLKENTLSPQAKQLQIFTKSLLHHPLLKSAIFPVGDGIGLCQLKDDTETMQIPEEKTSKKG